jgi:2-polyprenyl-6-methoxyphenol hydroxylase-like FAD-dependent oxidoreductase
MSVFDIAIVGGGPGGATLANIFASRGVKVALIERQKDFSKEFRGEALMPSGKEVLDQIGIDIDTENIKYRTVNKFNIFYKGTLIANPEPDFIENGEFRWVSQPQLLEKIIEKSSDYKNFSFYRGYKGQDLIYENNRVCGVKISGSNEEIDVKARVVIGFDGRSSMVRRKLNFSVKNYHQPSDVLWFKIPYPERAFPGSHAFFSLFPNSMLVCVAVYDEKMQVGWVIPSGSYGELKQQGKEKWIKDKSPKEFSKHLQSCLDKNEISDPFVLKMTLDRVKKWNKQGALLLGDAAHTMNAVGGQGLNIALRDAVVCANYLLPLFKSKKLSNSDLDFAFDQIEKERLIEVKQVQQIQSRPPKFILINKFLIDLIFPIIRFIFKFKIMNRIVDKEWVKISKGFTKAKLEV